MTDPKCSECGYTMLGADGYMIDCNCVTTHICHFMQFGVQLTGIGIFKDLYLQMVTDKKRLQKDQSDVEGPEDNPIICK